MAESDIERLRDSIDHAWDEARKFGLDPFPTHFELVPASIMYEFASYSLPGRFSHWTHGKAYHRQKMQYDFGLSKIYEMVVNTNPSYAFLMDMNNLLQNTFVAAHVFGHTDFFKNNAYFQHTSRRMIDKVSIHAERIAKYEFDHGKEEVEHFLDSVLSIQEHVDYNLLILEEKPGSDDKHSSVPGPYDDLWGMGEEQKKAAEERARRSGKPPKFPEKPQKDILLFLIQHAPHLEPWQRDIIEIVRSEMLYFLPQMQTKIMNEGWACLTGDSLVLTEHGLLRYETLHSLLAQEQAVQVASGTDMLDPVADRHITRQAATIRLHTRRGLLLEGAQDHKLSIGPETWLALKDVAVGQRIPLSAGTKLWPTSLVALQQPVSAHNRALSSSLARSIPSTPALQLDRPLSTTHLPSAFAPSHLTAPLAELLGYLLGSGTLDATKNLPVFVSNERALAVHCAQLVLDLFSLEATLVTDESADPNQRERWQVRFYSTYTLDLLQAAGLDLQSDRATWHVPAALLRSPEPVVSAFLRAYFDCAADVSHGSGIVLATCGEPFARELQILLLNYGMLSRRHGADLSIIGQSAGLFAREIGSDLPAKQAVLDIYLTAHPGLLIEDPSDEVVRIEHGCADVYDITVARSHRYVANGMLHHNSIWHSRIMRRLGETSVISDSQTIEFAQLHSGVLSPSRTSLNPYYLGFKMFEDIERRWDHPTHEEQDRLGRKPNTGLVKLFEVRELDNDVSFLRNYLTEDLVKELDLYMYKKEGDEWVIVEKKWEKVRDGIVASLTNFGSPYLVIDNGDYHGNRELYLTHIFEGQELDMNYAEKTLQHVYRLWSRPVHLETVYDGKKILISYDGERSSKTTLEK